MSADWPAAGAALGPARAVANRLTLGRDPEDTAADLLELWSTVERALRDLLGGSALSGQDLIREVRKRELLTLTQAHALLDFLAARNRVQDPAYKPKASDVETARSAVAQLDSGLTPARPAPVASAPVVAAAPGMDTAPVASTTKPGERFPTWAWIVIAAVAVALAGIGALYATGRTGDDLADGRRALREGRREAARAEFEQAVREHPERAEAHLFLARMSREDGDYARARTETEAAIRAEPRNGLAHREMGTLMYAAGNYEIARSFLVRAVQYRPDDPTAQGLLGCSLTKVGRRDEGLRFIGRAGPGAWSECAR